MTKRIWLLVLLLSCACSSTHDLKRDGLNWGAGFIDDEMAPGVYRIKGFSYPQLFPTPDSAAKTFRFRAEQLCPAGYDELRSVVHSYLSDYMVITSKIGFIRCNDSPLTPYEARMLVAPAND